MRILHTSDWHLGKMLMGKSRLLEQREALHQLLMVVKEEKIDAILVCGDIFDTFVPKAEAEELFFEEISNLSKQCVVVCIAGNHDDGNRLKAPWPIALHSDIYLVGDMDNTCFTKKGASGGDGWLKLDIGGEMLNLALLPYPFFSGLISQTKEGSNEQRIKELINRCSAGFGEGVNIFASHLFITGSEVAEDRELGTAPVLSKSVLPDCDYVALGHIHRPQRLSRTKNIFYSGSLLRYSFDDAYDKFFHIYDSQDKSIKTLPINAGKTLIQTSVNSFEQAEKILIDNPYSYVKLIYSGPPLMMSEIKKLKSYCCFTDIRIENPQAVEKKTSFRSDASPTDLFESFYLSRKKEQPKKELTELFLSVLGGSDATD